MKAFKFIRDDMRSGSGSEPAWKVGEKRTIGGKLKMCQRGYHSSPSWSYALCFAKGSMACVVEVSQPTETQSDKQVSHSCTIVKAVNVEKVLRTWGCDCAERALTEARVTDERSWDAIKVARLYNEGKATKEELLAARLAAWSAAEAAAEAAAWSAARLAAWSAAEAAAEAAVRSAAWSAARSAAWSAVRSAAEAAWSAEIEWQSKHLDELMKPLFEVTP